MTKLEKFQREWNRMILLGVFQVLIQVPLWLTWIICQDNGLQVPAWIATYVVVMMYFPAIGVSLLVKEERLKTGLSFFFFNLINFIVVGGAVGYFVLISR